MTCRDCGRPTVTGARCRACHRESVRRDALAETAGRDREVLDMIEGERLTAARLAARLGVSRVWASQKIRLARDRTARRAEGREERR